MNAMTFAEMRGVEGGSVICIALAILAIDLGLIGVMWGVYMSYQLGCNNPEKFAERGASSGGGGAG